ncbi:MAG: hypothetical protein AAF560_20055, partial [Acidobacteriota bacterium]
VDDRVPWVGSGCQPSPEFSEVRKATRRLGPLRIVNDNEYSSRAFGHGRRRLHPQGAVFFDLSYGFEGYH